MERLSALLHAIWDCESHETYMASGVSIVKKVQWNPTGKQARLGVRGGGEGVNIRSILRWGSNSLFALIIRIWFVGGLDGVGR